MSRHAKYITYEDAKYGTDSICIFSHFIEHNRMAMNLGNILGAGFIRFDKGEPVCYGDSFSLKIKSRPEDSEIAKYALGL